MPIYISLYKWTDHGIQTVKEAPARLDAARKAIETAGGKLLGFYVTMGQYDMVMICDFPSDEMATTYLLGVARLGNVRSETLRAFTEKEFGNILATIPKIFLMPHF